MEPFLHLIIPVALLLAFFPQLNRTLVLSLSFFTLLMDFDFFLFPSLHRVAFYSLFFVALVTFLVYFLWRNKHTRTQATFITLFFLVSHLILDLARPGVALFWPFVDRLFALEISIIDFIPHFDVFWLPFSVLAVEEPAGYLLPAGSLIIILVLILGMSKYIIWRKHGA